MFKIRWLSKRRNRLYDTKLSEVYMEECVKNGLHTWGFHWFQFCFILDHHSWLFRLCIRSSFLWLKELTCILNTSLVAQMVKNPPAMQETQVWSLGWEDPLEKGVATHCSILAWRIPRTEEPGGLQSGGWKRVRHNWAMFTYFFYLTPSSLLPSSKQPCFKEPAEVTYPESIFGLYNNGRPLIISQFNGHVFLNS